MFEMFLNTGILLFWYKTRGLAERLELQTRPRWISRLSL